jgi:site-specific DNA recombinase
MKVAISVRVSTQRQAQAQTIEQQLDLLRAYSQSQGWPWQQEHIFRDDGYSGASLRRPGLDRLRDQISTAAFDRVLITEPSRLARKYVHQMLLIEEFERGGCQVEFIDQPMSQSPHDQLLVQIRGAVAEYERSLIAERMRRGRLQKYQAGCLLPWTHAPYGYRLDPQHPRDPAGVRLEPTEAATVAEIFASYLQEGQSLMGVTKQLVAQGVPSPSGRWRWNQASVRGIVSNPAYTGTVYIGRSRHTPSRMRHSPLAPVGREHGGHPRTPPEEWVAVAQVPPIISQEQFDRVQAKLAHNQQFARRNNTTHQYLLRAFVSCGHCRLACLGRRSQAGYAYYTCRGKKNPIISCRDEKCPSRYIPADQLDDLVWQDVCEILTHPEQIASALQRAQGGQWLPQELQARRENLRKARVSVEQQIERLTDAYLASVLALQEYSRRRQELEQRLHAIAEQARQLEANVGRQQELAVLVQSIEAFCQRVQQGLAEATFEQKRQIIELLVDRVVVTEEEVEIRYVIPTSSQSEQIRFCHLRLDYFNLPSPPIGEEHLPCLCFCFDWIIGDQIHHSLFHPCFHQIQLFARTGMAHSRPPQITGHLLSGHGISDLVMRKIPFPLANLPELLFCSPRREKDRIFDPANDKTGVILCEHLEPIA